MLSSLKIDSDSFQLTPFSSLFGIREAGILSFPKGNDNELTADQKYESARIRLNQANIVPMTPLVKLEGNDKKGEGINSDPAGA